MLSDVKSSGRQWKGEDGYLVIAAGHDAAQDGLACSFSHLATGHFWGSAKDGWLFRFFKTASSKDVLFDAIDPSCVFSGEPNSGASTLITALLSFVMLLGFSDSRASEMDLIQHLVWQMLDDCVDVCRLCWPSRAFVMSLMSRALMRLRVILFVVEDELSFGTARIHPPSECDTWMWLCTGGERLRLQSHLDIAFNQMLTINMDPDLQVFTIKISTEVFR